MLPSDWMNNYDYIITRSKLHGRPEVPEEEKSGENHGKLSVLKISRDNFLKKIYFIVVYRSVIPLGLRSKYDVDGNFCESLTLRLCCYVTTCRSCIVFNHLI